ncbi:MAG: excinuclease ABC subunit UvrA [Desulfatitalea sp.]|nr:excinuclease ABC subunit UvrA [Desulfatitalea sp.]NNK00961.1 excinuclease ABC subunit UvrA [Desulfatitalea sp.]
MIKIRGARQHNLKHINLDIPRDQLVVLTGLSGSGKSTLAFDTLYAEGQRRYVESLSTYARQFLERLEKPEVDLIEGLSPAIAIEQKAVAHNPRSTVGTVTEIYDYLRLLFARIGTSYCHRCGRLIQTRSIDQMVDAVTAYPAGRRVIILAPLVKEKKGPHAEVMKRLRREGFARVRINGVIQEIEDVSPFCKDRNYTIEAVVDRLVLKQNIHNRLADSMELALSLSRGRIEILFPEEAAASEAAILRFSEKAACYHCGIALVELTPATFSFNAPAGACPQCDGLGMTPRIDARSPVPDQRHGPREDTVAPWVGRQSASFKDFDICHACRGARLRPESRAVKVEDMAIHEVTALSIDKAMTFFQSMHLDGQRALIADKIVREIVQRLAFLHDVGLAYLSLGRNTHTLSGGEAQRIRLATQIGAKLTGVLYVLDEPSIGLHQRDNRKLLDTLARMKALGNSVIVVEHDPETIVAADFVVDMGPGAGRHGGEVVFAGSPKDLMAAESSITGQYLSGQRVIEIPHTRRRGNGAAVTITGACHNNLKYIDVGFPLATFICVTGVSGSGKSSLVIETLYHEVSCRLKSGRTDPGSYKRMDGLAHIDKVVNVDQSPIGRTPRSNPSTYTGLFNHIRDLFSRTEDARMRGYKPGRFSFNVKGGRCEACSGDGIVKIEMHFLPDVYVPCDVCHGKRYNRETLEVRYKGRTIADVLEMTVDQAKDFFRNIAAIREKLQTLSDVGVGYIQLGQSATTLSGGEAQRVKLSRELSKRGTGRTLYILDEPTTGLHMEDIQRLLQVLARLVDSGNTVVVIEHHLDVIKTADHIIDLGPEGGDAGGHVVGTGTPEQIALLPGSYTGQYLKKLLMV